MTRSLVYRTGRSVWRSLPAAARHRLWPAIVFFKPQLRPRASLSLSGPLPLIWDALALPRQDVPFPPSDGGSELLARLLTSCEPPGLPWIVVLGPLDWSFRRQRPQKLSDELANSGFRVLYIDPQADHAKKPCLTVDRLGPNLFHGRLGLPQALAPWDVLPSHAIIGQIVDALSEAAVTLGIMDAWVGVMLPYWTDVAHQLRTEHGWRIWYDRMDHWAGFERVGALFEPAERRLLADADAGTATAETLLTQEGQVLVPNACDGSFFTLSMSGHPSGRRIGYVGAIAEWFDTDMVMAAARLPDVEVVLYGAVSPEADVERLRSLPNVVFKGEIPHADVAWAVDSFDVCLLPFKIRPLTLSTDPIKVYEYLARSKRVVASALPELRRFDGLVEIAATPQEFAACVAECLAAPLDRAAERRAAAEEHTWAARATHVGSALRTKDPSVSVVILNWNKPRLTAASIAVLAANSSHWNDLEIVCVDNGSDDRHRTLLEELIAPIARVRYVQTGANLGFAAGMNAGAEASTGDLLVLGNNDAFIGPGGIGIVAARLRDPNVGLLGPVTNWTGNEAKIDVDPDCFGAFLRECTARRVRHRGEVAVTHNLAFFTVAMRREVWNEVGPLDTGFGRGMFEDDDYCRRVRQRGYELLIANDWFVYHVGEASFGELKSDSTYDDLFAANRRYFEDKWGPWAPHPDTAAVFSAREFVGRLPDVRERRGATT